MGKRIGYAVAAPLFALVLALTISSIVLLVSGSNPWTAYGNVWEFGTRLETILEAINRASALYISGIAVAIGFRMNLFNIGVEGQYILAAFMAAAVGSQIGPMNPILHVAIILLTAVAVGAAWSGLAGLMKVTRNVHEVISTIMLNAIAVAGVVSFLLAQWSAGASSSQTLDVALDPIPDSGWLPSLNPVVEFFTRDIKRVDLFSFVLVAVAVGFIYHFLINKTRIGFDLRATGVNPMAAEASGVDPKKTILLAMVLSGAVAGLVGLGDLLGDAHTYNLRFFQGLGFSGIAVALLGRNNAIGVAFAAFAIGWLERSSGVLEVRGDASREIVTIMIGIIILAAVIAYALVERKRAADEARDAARVVEREVPS